MPKKKTKESQEVNLRVNVQALWEQLEQQGEFQSINQMYRNTIFRGRFMDCQEFSGKYGVTNRYTFSSESGDTWSLLSSSTILAKTIEIIPTGTLVEVFKNEKGIWMILPVLEE